MGVGARGSRTWRARSRAAISLLVLTSWFGTLLVAGPTVSASAATTPSPTSFVAAAAKGSTDPSFSFDLALTNDTAECALVSRGAGAPDPADPSWGTCTSPWSPAISTDGLYDGYVRTVRTTTTPADPADTSTVAIDVTDRSDPAGPAAYELDRTGPALVLTSGPDGTTDNVAGVTWVVDAGGASVTCTLTRDGAPYAAGPCDTGAAAFPGAALSGDGVYVLTATATDADGNTTASAATSPTATYTLDSAGPAISVAGPAGDHNDPTPQWTGTAGTDTVTCTLADAGGATVATSTGCASFGPTAALADGTYTLTATASDGVNTSTVTVDYRLDTQAPAVVVAPTSQASTDGAAGWTVTVTGGAAPTCVLTSPAAQPGDTYGTGTPDCANFTAVTLPREGTFTLTATSTDAAGNVGTATGTAIYRANPTVSVTPLTRTGFGTTVDWKVDADANSTVACSILEPGATTASAVGCTRASTPQTVLTGTDGRYTFTATATDLDTGFTSSAAATYDLDRVDPSISVSPTTTSSTTAAAGWSLTVGAGGLVPSCVLTSDTVGETFGDGTTGCGQFASMTLPHKGTYTLTATTADAAGNTASDVATWIYRDVPTVTVTTTRATGNSRGVSWQVTATAGTAVVCTLTDPDATTHDYPCTGSGSVATTVSTAEGTSTFSAVATDPQTGFTGSDSATYVYDITAPPAFTVTGTTGDRRVLTVDWSWTATAAATTCQLRSITDPTYALATPSACTPDYTTDLPGEGTWRLAVTLTDLAGNSTTALGPSVDVDLTVPSAPGVTTPKALSNDRAPVWTLTGEASATLRCSWTANVAVTLPAAGGCASPYSPTLPATDGTYTLHVTQTDPAGNTSAETAVAYQLDLTAPTVTFTQEPTGPSNATAVTWATTVNEPSAKTECQLLKRTTTADIVIYSWRTTGCARSVTETLTGGDGTYVLQVRDTDPAGNVDANGTTSAPYDLDTTGPGSPTVTGPAGDRNQPAVTWTVTPSPTDPGVGYLCRLVTNNDTSGAWVPCDTDATVPGITYSATLTDGTYRLDAVSTDVLGNRSAPVTSSLDLRLDTVVPAAAVFTGTSGTGNTPSRSWSWTGEAAAKNDCRLYSGASLTSLSLLSTTLDCTSPQAEGLVSPTAGTYYVLKVTQTDAAGNSTVTAGPDYLLDTVAPVAPSVTGPGGTDNVLGVQYAFVPAEPGTVARCQLMQRPLGSTTWTAIRTRASCPTTWNVTLPSVDGDYTARVTLTDAAGNPSSYGESGTYTLDVTGPVAAVFTGGPSGTANVKPATWSWTSEAQSTATCLVSHNGTALGSAVDCTGGTYSRTLTDGDGSYTLTVELTDQYGNVGGSVTSVGYTLDATPPGAPTVTGPTGTSNAISASYAISGPVEANATAECLLLRDGATVQGWASCTMPRTVALSGDGSYVLAVRLTDQYGNLGAVGTSPAYLLDTVLPQAPAVTAPPSPASSAAPQFTFTSDADTTTTCRLSRASVIVVDTTSCRGAFTAPLTGMPDGDYVLAVTATDPAGNVATGTSGAYTFDTTKPAPPVVTGLPGPSQTRNPVFGWTGEAGAKPECSVQEKAGSPSGWVTCSTPYTPSLTADGSWVLSVRLTDAAGNVSDAGSSGAYLLDTTAPTAPVVTSPTSPGRDLAPSWSAVTEEGSKTECRLTGPGQLGAWGACTLPMTTPISGDGAYTFEVRATDAAGNVSPPGSGSYELDTTAPGAPVVASPTSPGRTRAPSFSFTAEPGTVGSCRLTHGTMVLSDSAACGSPSTVDLTGLSDGAYTLSVRAVDAAGNIGPAGTATYVLDTTAPAPPTYTLIAGSPSSDRAPAFGFNTEIGATVGCKLTMPSGAVKDLSCTSPLTLDLSNATDGDYLLTLRATDPAGNVSAPAGATYHFDSTAPAAPKVVGPPTPGSIRNPVWRISSSSPDECRLIRGTTVVKDWASCGTSYAADLYAQPDGVYLLEARVVGTAAATTSRYRLDTTGPAAATIVGPPSPSTVRKPTWAVASADTTVTAECRIMVFTGVLRDWATCGVSPAGSLFALDLTGLGDGTYTLVVRLTDAAGNVGSTATSDYVLDTSAPAAVGVLAPLSPGNDTTPTWTLTSAPGVKLECRVSTGQKVVSDFAPCSGTFTADLTGLPDGTYTLTVHALSAAGTPGPETTSGYILDTTAAGAPGTLSGPAGPSRDRAPKWTFTLAAGTKATCKVTVSGKVFRDGPCSSPFVLDLSNAADGTYTLTVRAVDAAGNLGSPSTAGYILKTTPPPPPVLTMQPGSPSSSTDPRWGFSLFRGTTAQCRLLQAGAALEDWTACSSPAPALLSGKPDGAYTMQVRAIDVAGNTSAAVSGDYVFDRSAAPLAVFLDTPPTPGNDLTPSWRVAAPAAVAPAPTAPAATAALVRAAALTGAPQVECRLTTPRGVGGWAPCSGTYTAATNGDGTYLLEARAFDATGERGPASSSSYLLDTRSPPAPRFTDPLPPSIGNDPEVPWSWADEDDLVECRLLRDGRALGSFASCDPPYVAAVGRLGEATYAIEVRAIDPAGNVSPVATASYRYDVTAPAAPVFVSRPPSRGTAGSAVWTFAVPLDAGAVCIARRNGTVVAEGACAGSYAVDLRGQQPATWALSVHFVDTAGNVGPSTVGSYTLTSAVGRGRVDQTGPGGGTGGTGPTASGPDGATTSGPGLTPPLRTPDGGAVVVDHSRTTVLAKLPEAIKKGAVDLVHGLPGIPGAVPGTDVPKAIKNVLGQTITKPQLPLALFVIVLLFLLVQNQIDRRDPKLAAAPVTAEPELTFGPTLRPGGATA